MKICFFITTLTKGGAERVVANLANYLSNNNEIEKVDILNMYNTEKEYKINSKIDIYTLDKKYIDHKKLANNHKQPLKFLFHIIKVIKYRKLKHNLKKFLGKAEYDAIICFLPEPSFMMLSLKKYAKCPIIISDRNDPNLEYRGVRNNYLMKKLYPRAKGFVFQTEDAKNYFKDIIKCKSTIIANPVNEKFVAKSFETNREKNIVNVGRLEEQKNQKLLIQAFSNMNKKFSDYKLIIFGDGSLKKQLEEYIEYLNLTDRVILAGQVDNLEEKICKASLFVLSSFYEGMPNALIEAMCLGVPSISTDCPCGGPRMLIQNGRNGILVENNNSEELTKAMEKILSDKEELFSIGKNAMKLSEKLNSDVINSKWIKFIKNVINEEK